VPVISRFFGITITRYYNDLASPHVHASYQGSQAVVKIERGRSSSRAAERERPDLDGDAKRRPFLIDG